MKYGYYEVNESPSPIEDYTEGAHIIVLRKVKDFVKNTCILEDTGWAVRDSIKVITETESFNATLFRKPFKGTVANNVLENGCGGLNIDSCRISHNDPMIIRKDFSSNTGDIFTRAKGNSAGPSPEGRFPSNLILIHANGNEGCPVKKLDIQSGDRSDTRIGNPKDPVKSNSNKLFGGVQQKVPTKSHCFRDVGGASRYFKQVHSLEELKEYLVALIRC